MIETVGGARLASLLPRFPADTPNAAVLHGVLTGANAGTVLVDDVDRPSRCVLKPVYYGFTFIGGAVSGTELAEAIETLRHHGFVSLVVRECDSWQSVGVPRGDEEIERWEFSGRAANADETARRVPDGCEVRRIDADTFARCLWRQDMVRTFGTAERYLAESIGTCLVRGDAVLSEAHAAFWGPGVAEIGAVTARDERGHGHAPVVVARLIQECAARGAQTVWSCDQANAASARVARKLGYARERAYRLLEYARAPAASDAASS